MHPSISSIQAHTSTSSFSTYTNTKNHNMDQVYDIVQDSSQQEHLLQIYCQEHSCSLQDILQESITHITKSMTAQIRQYRHEQIFLILTRILYIQKGDVSLSIERLTDMIHAPYLLFETRADAFFLLWSICKDEQLPFSWQMLYELLRNPIQEDLQLWNADEQDQREQIQDNILATQKEISHYWLQQAHSTQHPLDTHAYATLPCVLRYCDPVFAHEIVLDLCTSWNALKQPPLHILCATIEELYRQPEYANCAQQIAHYVIQSDPESCDTIECWTHALATIVHNASDPSTKTLAITTMIPTCVKQPFISDSVYENIYTASIRHEQIIASIATPYAALLQKACSSTSIHRATLGKLCAIGAHILHNTSTSREQQNRILNSIYTTLDLHTNSLDYDVTNSIVTVSEYFIHNNLEQPSFWTDILQKHIAHNELLLALNWVFSVPVMVKRLQAIYELLKAQGISLGKIIPMLPNQQIQSLETFFATTGWGLFCISCKDIDANHGLEVLERHGFHFSSLMNHMWELYRLTHEFDIYDSPCDNLVYTYADPSMVPKAVLANFFELMKQHIRSQRHVPHALLALQQTIDHIPQHAYNNYFAYLDAIISSPGMDQDAVLTAMKRIITVAQTKTILPQDLANLFSCLSNYIYQPLSSIEQKKEAATYILQYPVDTSYATYTNAMNGYVAILCQNMLDPHTHQEAIARIVAPYQGKLIPLLADQMLFGYGNCLRSPHTTKKQRSDISQQILYLNNNFPGLENALFSLVELLRSDTVEPVKEQNCAIDYILKLCFKDGHPNSLPALALCIRSGTPDQRKAAASFIPTILQSNLLLSLPFIQQNTLFNCILYIGECIRADLPKDVKKPALQTLLQLSKRTDLPDDCKHQLLMCFAAVFDTAHFSHEEILPYVNDIIKFTYQPMTPHVIAAACVCLDICRHSKILPSQERIEKRLWQLIQRDDIPPEAFEVVIHLLTQSIMTKKNDPSIAARQIYALSQHPNISNRAVSHIHFSAGAIIRADIPLDDKKLALQQTFQFFQTKPIEQNAARFITVTMRERLQTLTSPEENTWLIQIVRQLHDARSLFDPDTQSMIDGLHASYGVAQTSTEISSSLQNAHVDLKDEIQNSLSLLTQEYNNQSESQWYTKEFYKNSINAWIDQLANSRNHRLAN